MTLWIDVIVIGAGMAGASLAAALAPYRKVALLEREGEAGYHTTGRSAATYEPSYGNQVIGKLTRASRGMFERGNDEGLPFLKHRQALWLADEESLPALEEMFENGAAVRKIELADARQFCERLNIEALVAAAIAEDVHDIDVDLLHQHFLRQFRSHQGRLVLNADVTSIKQRGTVWHVEAGGERYAAAILVNASGAWGDEIAAMAGVDPVGLQPKRRTGALIDAPIGVDFQRWPLIADADERWYCRPMGGQLMVSPADETPVDPHDAFPEEIDIATGIDRFEKKIDIQVNHVSHSWAGLRSFVADKSPVIGFDPDRDGFFWCVGQGGYGIQTAPAAADFGASLLLRRGMPDHLQAQALDPLELSAARLRANVDIVNH